MVLLRPIDNTYQIIHYPSSNPITPAAGGGGRAPPPPTSGPAEGPFGGEDPRRHG